jgi:hypothetical protein
MIALGGPSCPSSSTRARRATGGTFEGPSLIHGTVDLTCELEGLPVQGQCFLRPCGLGQEGACAVESLGFPLHITEFSKQCQGRGRPARAWGNYLVWRVRSFTG